MRQGTPYRDTVTYRQYRAARVALMNSEKLRRYLRDQLTTDPRIDASGIDVRVDDRLVTVSGHVPSYIDKWAIKHAVLALKGVRGLALDIEVACPVECAVADDEIARRATSRLALNSAIPQGAIKVTVNNGRVTLTGTVDWQFQRALAEHDVEFLAGVTDITNNITLSPVPPVEGVKRSVEQAIRRLADVADSRIHVSVGDTGVVTLRGRVDHCQERAAVEEAVWSIAGVRQVDDQITVR